MQRSKIWNELSTSRIIDTGYGYIFESYRIFVSDKFGYVRTYKTKNKFVMNQ